MARNLREVIAAVSAERRAKVVAAYRQKLIAVKKKRQLKEAKRFMELDHKLISAGRRYALERTVGATSDGATRR